MLSPFLPVPVRVLELESSGADPESSGAVDLETKRGISTPESCFRAHTISTGCFLQVVGP